jgi:lipopolysaccharide export system protein LptA
MRVAAALGLAAAWALAAGSALAERADLEKPLNIESDSMIADEAKRIATFEGKVVLIQGSLIIRADRIVVRQDRDGFYNGVATGSPATFRHKQEGSGDYIDGEALKIEYDNKLDRVEFSSRARLRRDSGDDIRGDTISYDAKSERFAVKSAGAASGTDRVRATIMPKKPAAAPDPPVTGASRQD